DAAANASDVARAQLLSADHGIGVVLSGRGGQFVTLAAEGDLRYSIPTGTTTHVLTQLAPKTGYAVTITSEGQKQTVRGSRGGTRTSSAAGALSFRSDASGTISDR